MISHKHKFISLHVPKTGGTSINASLKTVFGAHCKWTGHIKLRGLVGNKQPEWCEDYFKFAFVRNPWDRFLSCYTYFKKYGIRQGHDVATGEIVNKFSSFEEFTHSFKSVQPLIKSSHLKNQTEWLDERLNFVGRFESLQTDFNYICDTIGIAPHTLPHQNKSSHKPYDEYYTDEMVEVVRDIYRADIEALEYSFNEKHIL
jgi:chondroitin 4-sulfotransferase 11|tara:strand:- start:941 stop:1543 length:603 start_codon:yes stop_codon:yes gene_type:complete